MTEQSPLLKRPRARSTTRRKHSRRLSSAAGEQHGDATVTQAVLMVTFITQSFLEPNMILFFAVVEIIYWNRHIVLGQSLPQRRSFVFDSHFGVHCRDLVMVFHSSDQNQECGERKFRR